MIRLYLIALGLSIGAAMGPLMFGADVDFAAGMVAGSFILATVYWICAS